MDILASTIATMTKEEVRHLKLHLSRFNLSEDRKDEFLFDYIRSHQDNYNEEKILKKLYNTTNKNAFYRLRGRLQDTICQNLTMLHEKKNDNVKLYLYIAAYNIFLEKNNFDIALHYLKKAEKLATTVENFEILDMIFAAFISLSNDLSDLNPEAYIEKRRSNAERANKLREMSQILALVVYRLKISQAKGKKDDNTIDILEGIIAKHSIDKSLTKSKIFQTKIYRSVSQILLQRHNYEELEKFMKLIYHQFIKEGWFDKNNHDTKLQMLVYLINTLSRNRKHAESLKYNAKLKTELDKFNRLYYAKYVFYYYNALVINYSENKPLEALKALKDLEAALHDTPNSYYDMFIQLNRGLLYFKVAKYNEAIRCFVRYYTNEHYKKMDNLFKLRVATADLLMQVESKDMESAKIRLEQVQKQFSTELKLIDAYAEHKVQQWIKLLLKNNLIYKENKVQSALNELLLDDKMFINEDAQLLNYKSWLQSKVIS
jgi:hypothetical protein